MDKQTQEQDQEQGLDLEQEYAFGGSAVPLMSFIGEAGRSIVEPQLARLAENWAYPDRLLCWLEPSLKSDIRKYYESNGPEMSSIFAEHQLVHLDRDLSQVLLTRMSRIDRNVTIVVVRWLKENGVRIELGESEEPFRR